MVSSARDTLNAARRFLRQAGTYGVEDPEGFAHNVNAAIVFGRSVTWHIQKDYKHDGGFDEWYAGERKVLTQEPLCRFFHESRRIISHQKLTATRRRYSLLLEDGIILMEGHDAEMFIVRPWNRRSFREHWEGVLRRVRKPLTACRIRLHRQIRATKERWTRWTRRDVGGSVNLFFDDPAWNETPAFDLVAQYLDILEGVVSRAEKRFEGEP